MLINKIDYKGKWFVLQDRDIEDKYGMDYVIGEVESEDLDYEYLEEHVENCMYYGIPAYVGEDEKLKERIDYLSKRIELLT